MTNYYIVITACPGSPLRTFHLFATSKLEARLAALELAGPGAVVVRCTKEGEW